ncbi:MAG: 3-dehydroquinate synthase [Clostridia bacterium]|nr:3-dehydroquinate synthase [Clostridia bacterium]
MEQITLQTPSMQGQIYVGEEVLAERLPLLTEGQKNFVVTDVNVYALYPSLFKTYFRGASIFVLPAGEEFKNFQSLYQILRKMTKAGLHLTSRLFAVGGGVVGDIGGLAAALFMRGISCVQIPTTLLAQVDSSVGGKTAVDLGGVKNAVGAFYQPREVLVDPTFLQTLPKRELKCGVGEIVKYAALSGEIFDLLQENIDRLEDQEFLKTLITACIRHKACIVQADEKESGERRSLNVGHTTGHAIELFYGLSHGESVLYGMALETKIAIAADVCDREYGEKLLHVVNVALQISPCSNVDFRQIGEAAEKARSDKKNADDGKIQMAVAKAKGEWMMLALSFEDYRTALLEGVKSGIKTDEQNDERY